MKLRTECLFNISALYVMAEILQRQKDISLNQCMTSWSILYFSAWKRHSRHAWDFLHGSDIQSKEVWRKSL